MLRSTVATLQGGDPAQKGSGDASWTLSSAAEWPQFHRDSAHSGWSGAVAPNTPNVPWSKVLMVGGAYGHDRYSPIVYAQKVYVVVHATLRAYTVGGLDAWPVRCPCPMTS